MKTNEGQNIILLDYYGYKLAPTQQELTIPQTLFITKGRIELDKKKAQKEKQEIEKAKRNSKR